MIGPFSGEHRYLSNFFMEPARMLLSNEHFFQAEKSLDPDERAFVMSASGPIEAKKRGRQITLRDDWDLVKNQVMLSGLRNKFYLDTGLGAMLLGTGDEELVEVNHWGDRYWGVDGEGENHLGILLMQVRAELKSAVETERRLWAGTMGG
ncbi:hypothetical protein SEA_A3WALLY_274 [Microbacterium phage A3Wally]|nr:hypothetical protein SEA_A3WALLY_274 [Microbacterium phage A3Wally]